MNRRPLIALAALMGALALGTPLAGCSSDAAPAQGAAPAGASNSYQQVDAEAAKQLMDAEEDYVILDVRTQAEYDGGHIPGAQLLPHDTVSTDAEDALPNKDQLILVYCRSGNRSKQASQALADLGYTNVVEFGGINDWPYEVE